jgi:hypothetical protein
VSSPDPFVRSIVIILDRVAVLLSLSAVGCALVWDATCQHAFGSNALAFELALRVLAHRGDPILETLFALTLALAVISTSVLSFGLFALWRRRARLAEQHVRGPR